MKATTMQVTACSILEVIPHPSSIYVFANGNSAGLPRGIERLVIVKKPSINGLGYSCCKKRVISFDEFLILPGCTSGSHSTEQTARPAPVSTAPTSATLSAPTSMDGATEVYGSSIPVQKVIRTATPQPPVEPEPLEQDDPSIPIEEGTKCTRKGCNEVYMSDEVSRGDGPQARCVFHPGYVDVFNSY